MNKSTLKVIQNYSDLIEHSVILLQFCNKLYYCKPHYTHLDAQTDTKYPTSNNKIFSDVSTCRDLCLHSFMVDEIHI